ncbi:MAG TPA: serine hydrolase [Candidatus Limnocylindria bacterium]|nr:serine hydrolase [Candidatus Limnocylindria bacterium]
MAGLAADLAARIDPLAAKTGGVVGLSVTQLAGGAHFGLREDELFPLASLVKAPILVALFDGVRAGSIDLEERVTYRRALRVPGSGVLQDLDDGLAPTVRDLAMLMITVSDNTSADLLLERVGKDGVERAMDAIGCSSVRVPFSIMELFEELTDSPGADYETLQRLLRASAGSGGRAIVAETGVRGTPRDMCRLFELLESRAILDEASCAAVLDILKRTKTDTRIPALLPKGTIVAHKTGTIRGVRCDAGIVYAPNGPYAIAIMSKGVRSDLRVDLALAEISLAVYEALVA